MKYGLLINRLLLLSLILAPLVFFGITCYSTESVLSWNATSIKKVAAFYYQWYGNTTDYSSTTPINVSDTAKWWHWDYSARGWYPPANACSANTPEIGWYDSSDPATIKQHLQQAEWAGIDAFVSSYWGQNGQEMKNIKTMLEIAKNINSNVSIAPYFEIFLGDMERKNITDQITLLTSEFRYLHDTLSEEQYKDQVWFEDGKPVVWIYVVRAVSVEVWESVITTLKNEQKELFLVADRPHDNPIHIQLFQAQHQYDVYAPIRDMNYFSTFYHIKTQCKAANQIFIAGVAPAYNDTVVRDGNAPFGRKNGQFYEDRWENALALNPDWISITSWNEWHEGTEIEPSVENGDLALNQTRTFIREFKSNSYTTLKPTSSLIIFGQIWFTELYWFAGIYIALGIVALLTRWLLTNPKNKS